MSELETSQTVWEGKTIAVRLERWDGHDLEIVERVDAVAVVPVDRNGNVVLVRQFRGAVRGELLEVPAGKIDDGEEPEDTARRELEEETGLRGGDWESGPSVYVTPGFCTERVHLFVARDVEYGAASPDVGESFELVRWPVDEVADRLAEIEDAKTLVGLLFLLRRRRR